MNRRLVVSRALVLVSGLVASVLLSSCASGGPGSDDLVKREVFFVGGRYVGETGKEVMQGAMYVEHLSPPRSRERYRLVLIHGGGQTATNWMTTPDGRKGWAQYFVEQGFKVYMVDQSQRGRSAWHNGIDGALTSLSVSAAKRLFTAPEQFRQWPQANAHMMMLEKNNLDIAAAIAAWMKRAIP